MTGWVRLVGWPIADGLPTLVVTHQLQVERRTGKVRRPETDVLPLCHATSAVSCIKQNILYPEIQHSRLAAVYADHSEQQDRREISSEKDSTLLAQLRSGHCIRLQAYKHFMDTFSVVHTLSCSGQVGQSGKTYSVVTWCACHQQQRCNTVSDITQS